MATLTEQIEAFRELVGKPNWDSYGAMPVRDKTIGIAFSLADALQEYGFPVTLAVPTNDGGVEFSDGDETLWIRVQTDETA